MIALAAFAAVAPASDSGGKAPAAAFEHDASLRLRIPVAGVRRADVRDTFSEPRAAHPHEAIDIPALRGTPVLAAAAGRIVKLFTSAAGGLTIYQFDATERYALYYAHLDGYARDLREGMLVDRGQVIGYVGTTGNAPAAVPHLHFAVFRLGPGKEWWKGTAVDPYTWFEE